MSTFCGFNCALDGVPISPALLNSRSDGELLAWIDRYFRASWQSMGNSTSLWVYGSVLHGMISSQMHCQV